MLTFDPDGFKAIESVEIDKIGAAETGDNWKPPSIWSQAREKHNKQSKDVGQNVTLQKKKKKNTRVLSDDF